MSAEQVAAKFESILARAARIRPRDKASNTELAALKDDARAGLAEAKAVTPPPPPPPAEPPLPPPAAPLFRETFDTSPAPTNYGDTAIWNNDGEKLPVSGGVGHADVDKIRLWGHATFKGNVAVSAQVHPLGFRAGYPSSWAGFKFYLRRDLDQTVSGFYTAEPLIADGSVRIQKKERDGETYHVLAEKKLPPTLTRGDFKAVVSGTNPVTIDLYRDGEKLLTAIDNGSVGGAPYPAGHFGFRSDFLRYDIDDFRVDVA